jgi:RimJ/RimL family protein N-acetyltransferase
LTKCINSTDCKLFILLYQNKGIGQIRFDFDKKGKAFIDYSIEPNSRGNGFGKKIVQLGVEQLKGYGKVISAKVIGHNIASKRVFESLGFNEKRITSIKGSFSEYEKKIES